MSKRLAILFAAVLLLGACARKQLAGRASPPPAGAVEANKQAAQPSATYPQARPLDEAKAVEVRADRLSYTESSGETRFSGNVVVKQDTAVLYADRLVTKNKKETGHAEGNVRLVDRQRQLQMRAQQVDYANRLSEAKLLGGIELVTADPYGRGLTVTADSGKVWPRDGKALLEGSVLARRGAVTATARRAAVDQQAGTVVLDEGVRVRMGDNRFRSRMATFKQEGRVLVLEGEVKARFTPADLEKASQNPGEMP